MITAEMLTLPALPYANGGNPRLPAEGFVEFVNAVLAATETGFEEWSFHGQEGTQAVGDGYFSGLYKGKRLGWEGFGLQFSLSTGLFRIDAKQCFSTDAAGAIWWFLHGYRENEKGRVRDTNPELIRKAQPMPRRRYGLSLSARRSLQELAQISRPPH